MCTIFSWSDDRMALGGNNEDGINPYTHLWHVPREGGEIYYADGNYTAPWIGGKYARNYCGYIDLFPQGGMNETGLFFDGSAVSPPEGMG